MKQEQVARRAWIVKAPQELAIRAGLCYVALYSHATSV